VVAGHPPRPRFFCPATLIIEALAPRLASKIDAQNLMRCTSHSTYALIASQGWLGDAQGSEPATEHHDGSAKRPTPHRSNGHQTRCSNYALHTTMTEALLDATPESSTYALISSQRWLGDAQHTHTNKNTYTHSHTHTHSGRREGARRHGLGFVRTGGTHTITLHKHYFILP
jgi:hypothetical protein